MFYKLYIAILLSSISFTVLADDMRTKVEFPPMMRDHMLSNMRDHLLAIQEITHNLSVKKFDNASEIAEQRLGMSSM